ncbi:DinB family protein [Streptomyces botrytidirepellens]|uniref:DinB family protein n=1 Tax=Streptomyces botrytidirepellens TaxID=2486417 RepID=A0A3M8VQM5_9ACTN|nr:DinB family protein [Streptomyces botrytidirepellens]RNG19820.1 DinB family protein [Streptomyces botrytidirepellens]
MTRAAHPADEPPHSLTDTREMFDAYLDYYRAVVLRKLDGLSEAELRTSRLPSGWTPLELLRHLTFVERRWLRWGFLGEPVDAPWGDRGPDDRWQVPDDLPATEVRARFEEQCAWSRAAIAGVPLERRARTGGRFATEADAPALGWILFHLLQEYARHAGQLDVVRELADGAVGE